MITKKLYTMTIHMSCFDHHCDNKPNINIKKGINMKYANLRNRCIAVLYIFALLVTICPVEVFADTSFVPGWPFASKGYDHYIRVVDNYSPQYSSKNHYGMDIAAEIGDEVLAVESGTIIKVVNSKADSYEANSWGNYVKIEHTVGGSKYYSLYAHLKKGSIKVREKENVNKGDIIGLVGVSGASTGPHLHLEMNTGKRWFQSFEYYKDSPSIIGVWFNSNTKRYSKHYSQWITNNCEAIKHGGTTYYVYNGNSNSERNQESNRSVDPELNMLSQSMLVNVGKGYTLRFCSTTNHNKAYAIGSIPNEATIYVYGITKQQYDDRTWAKVNYNGTDGWVNYEYLTPVPSISTTPVTPTPTMQIREYSITFDANGGTGIMVETEMTVGAAKPLPANTFKRPQYKFAGWATSPSGNVVYADQQTVDLSTIGGVCIGLYAVWEPELQPTVMPVLSITEYNYPSDIEKGSNFGIRGIVQTSAGVITEINGYILDGNGNVIQSSRKTPNETSHNLRYSINNDLVFGKLTAGDYIYRVAATAVNGDQTATQTLIDSTFTVLGDRVETSPTSMPDQTIVKPTAPWISVSTNEVTIDRAAGDSAYVSVTYGGDMPNGCYLNMAAAGPFICEWIDDQSFVINAFDTGAADLDVLLCEKITDVVVAKQTIHVEVVDNTQVSVPAVQQAPASPPDLPGYRLATKLDTDFVLDVVGHGTSNGDNVQLSKNNSTDSQGFVITDAGAGYRTIMNYNSGLYLTADGSGASGSNVYQWEYTGKDTQLWQFIEDEDGSYLIVSKASGCYLDVDNAWANDGTNVKMFDRNGGYDAQNWYIQAAYLK
ncbi:MAG: RICIN domain-containing protein [Oscillospiraceae bacterium]|nr:RICIN domain-containing protein [Oscillospiraceae bacterium]